MLFLSRLIVLLLIRKGLLRVLIQSRRLVRLLELSHNNTGGDTLRRDKEYLRSVSDQTSDSANYRPGSEDVCGSDYVLLTGPPHHKY